MPTTIIEDADLPVYTSGQLRERRLAELNRVEETDRVPQGLLRRWRDQLTDTKMWDFRPRVVHGDLSEDNLVLNQKKITEVTGWSEVCVGDPAMDFSWLLACESRSFIDQVMTVYAEQMPQRPDTSLSLRANLYAEFALAQWLIRGIELDDSVMIEEADELLHTLESDLRRVGEISDSSEAKTAPEESASAKTG